VPKVNKCVKALLITIAVIAVVAGVIYFLTRKTSCCDMEDCDCFDDEFDLDDDLKPVDREYVPLNKTTDEAKEHTPSDPLLNAEEKVSDFAEKANEKAADIFARASAKASDIADIANDKVSDFMNKTSDIIKNEKDFIKEKEETKEKEVDKSE
jgi:hypothetical protein